MDVNTAYLFVSILSMLLSAVFYVVLKILSRRADRSNMQAFNKSDVQLRGSSPLKRKQRLYAIMLKAYMLCSRAPILRVYIQRIRRRLQAIHAYDERTMRCETMKIVLCSLGMMTVFATILLIMNHDLTFMFMLLLGAVVGNRIFIETFIHKVEDRLLVQCRELLKDVRHHYHQHGMIEEALYDAAEGTAYEAALHAKKIHQILISSNPEESLSLYYEQAPNRFLKAFAGMSFLVKEFGDKLVNRRSLYLDNLNKLTGEINLEILNRSRLIYLFKGLTTIAVTPILFTKPIEGWARHQFPAMDAFYTSKLGFMTQMFIYAIILLSYMLLKKMQDQQEIAYVPRWRKRSWEKAVLHVWIMQWVMERLVPAPGTGEYFKISRLLKATNTEIPLAWHYLHRLITAVLCTITMLTAFTLMHVITVQNVLHAPTANDSMFGRMSNLELERAQFMTEFDRQVMNQLTGRHKQDVQDEIVQILKQDQPHDANDTWLPSTTLRILAKVERIDAEYMKWWELLISFAVGWVGFQAPYWLLLFQQRMRQMDMQNEVDQFHTIIAMLSEMERISVENIVEWLERFALIFKAPIHTCVMNYESGAEEALEQLKLDIPFTPMVRTVDKLLLAVERIPIKQAFDDLETERAYYFEQRKLDYERTLDTKAGWGKIIGFAPMYSIVFLYIVIPFVYMSFQQLGVYYEQLNKL